MRNNKKKFQEKIIFSLLNISLNNNIAILDTKIMFFCLKPNFGAPTILNLMTFGRFKILYHNDLQVK